ncbi:2'-5' RNA ligase family protein [Rothia nasimurium]|uniref:2'-5' RNA ligase family protein n=3 Tax=Rothia nasimurium TaxID=85336 RepID=UPI001F272D92|nr:2'-5' RNA ligase family protein [Rothia nasimurium]
MAEYLVAWRARQGLTGPAAESCHITVLMCEDAGAHEPLETLGRVLAGWGPVEVELGGAETFEPVTPVTYLPVVAGADQLQNIHRTCQQAVGESASPFPYTPHLTLANHAPSPALAASLRDFATLPPELERFTVGQLTVYRYSSGSWQELGTIDLSRSPAGPGPARLSEGGPTGVGRS